MLKSTADLLVTVHHFFDEINYNPKSDNFEHIKALGKTIYTINHTKDLEDALAVARQYEYYVKHKEKFIKMMQKYASAWDKLTWHVRGDIAVVDNESAYGYYYITNVYTLNYKNVYITSQSFDNDFILLSNRNGYFCFNEDAVYYLRYATLSSCKMVLTNKEKKNIATIELNENEDYYGLSLENNKTQYELVTYDDLIVFFEKKYIDTIKDEPNLEKCKGAFQWDILSKNSEYGLSRLAVFDENADIDLMITIAASCFLIFRSFYKNVEATNHGLMTLSNILLLNALKKH